MRFILSQHNSHHNAALRIAGAFLQLVGHSCPHICTLYIQIVFELESCLQVILFWGVGGGVGVIGGGFFGQWLYNRKAFLMPIFVGVCACGASFPIWFLLNANLQQVHYFFSFAAAFLGGMLSSPPGPNAR